MNILHPSVPLAKREKLGDDLFKMSFDSPDMASHLKPGNFVHIRVTSQVDPLFRRAMSIHWRKGDTFTILFRVVGKGTRLLSCLRDGDKVDILGPLGNSFDFPGSEDIAIMVGGGTGMPPLHFLSRTLIEQDATARKRIHFLCGISSKADLPLASDVEKLGVDFKLSSDDGSVGHKGFVTELLEKELEGMNPAKTKVYSCGPANMLKAVSKICSEPKIKCQISLEGSMPCGIGTCLGCAVRSTDSKDQFKRICKEGPVFYSDEVKPWAK